MKRIITYLVVLLIAVPVLGQIDREERHLTERLKKHKIIDAFKDVKRLKNKSHYAFIVNFNKSLQLYKAVNKKELDSLVSSQWDENVNDWVKDSKEEFTYDANENINSFVSYRWDSNNQDWEPLFKFEFVFDSNRNLTELINYSRIGNQWIAYTKNVYEYNTSNNPTLDITYFWDYLNWVQSYKTDYTYDSNQNLILTTYSEWYTSDNNWYFVFKNELNYDVNNNLLSEYLHWWNFGTMDWDDASSKWEYEYDASNNLISEINSYWNTYDWTANQKYEYTYNASGQLTVDTGSEWKQATNQWDYIYKDEYMYDANGNRTLGNYYEPLQNPGEWLIYYKDEFIFDLAFNMDDIIGPPLTVDVIGAGFGDIVVSINNMVIGYQGYEYSGGMWEHVNNVLFYYSNYTNPLKTEDEILAKSLKIYPNPVDQFLTIDSEIPLTKVEIYSILGDKVKVIGEGFNNIPMNNLSSGVYILKILSVNGSTTKKLIKK